MQLTAGQALSFYEVLGTLGSGAMGEVYRAKDTRLGREVAIKVLPDHFAEEDERLARFEREARSLASLNHPNIAQIHGVDQVDDTYFLVLELVPGESLDERLRRGPLPLDEALDVCRQIAEGLEAAHEAGVIHRDLKPANVRVTPDGKAKLLDFGLAKPTAGAGDVGSGTDSVLTTEAGRLLGTPTYMAPEQARGKPIDRRVDVWAFGCVLYECLTGVRAFEGETLSDVLGAVLHTAPDLALLPRGTPRRVRELLADCLAKDPRERARDCGEIRRQLERVQRGGGVDEATQLPASERRRAGPAWTVAAIAAAVALAAWLWRAPETAPAPPAGPVVRTSIVLPRDFHLADIDRPIALSPDGNRLALVGALGSEAVDRIWIRPLDGDLPQQLAGSEGASYPFWSPDGREIAFFADGRLKRMPAVGGTVTTVCASESSRGGTWSELGDIVFTPDAYGPLYRVAASGGTPVPITSTEERESHRLPCFLPGGRRLLYSRDNTDEVGIYVLDLDSGERRRIVDDRSDARYASSGVLLFVRPPNLMMQALDPDTLELAGEARVVVEGIGFNSFRMTGPYTASSDGHIAYAPVSDQRRLRWFDAEGRPGASVGAPDHFTDLSLTADGRRIVTSIMRGGSDEDVWILDAERGLGSKLVDDASRPFAAPGFASRGAVVYGRLVRVDVQFLAHTYLRPLDGSAPEREIGVGWGCDASPDGEWLLLYQQRPKTGFDLWAVRDDGTGEQFPVATTTANEMGGRFSPDGRWVAFASSTSGRTELFLQPFPGPGAPLQLTSDGVDSERPLAWLKDGRMIYRDDADPRLLRSIQVDTSGPQPVIGSPIPFCGDLPIADGPTAVSADGERVLVAVPVDRDGRPFVNLIQNALADTARTP